MRASLSARARLLAWLTAAAPEPSPVATRALLAAALALGAALMLVAGTGLSFSGDELFYFARLVDREGVIAPYEGAGLEYLLAPHNGHLQLTGKLVYELVFGVAGADYTVLRAIEVLGVLLCVVAFFLLAKRRVGGLGALAGSVWLLLFGSAWEVMLWPFDMHTVYALAAGLGALLVLEREGRHADPVACALLCASVLTIELGLSFALGVGASILARHDRWRRLWVVAVPVALYASWRAWASSFEQPSTFLGLSGLPESLAGSLSAVLASLFGLNPYGAGVYPYAVGLHFWGAALAIIALAALGWRLIRGGAGRSTGVLLAVLLGYWSSIALGGRPPDSSRYLFAGALLVLLVAADLARGRRLSRLVIATLFVLIAVAVPANVGKLRDGRHALLADAWLSRSGYAMLELAGEGVDPSYAPSTDEQATGVGPVPFFGLEAGTYLAAMERVGSLAYPLEEVERQVAPVRMVADVVLVNALELRLRAPAPPLPRCRPVPLASGTSFEIPPAGALLRSRVERQLTLRLARFAPESPSASVGALPSREWRLLEIPPDGAEAPWRGLADGPLELCPPR